MANPKPLRSMSNPEPQDIQFKHFGVMNAGAQSKASMFTSITVNVILALVIVIIGAAARQKVIDNRKTELAYVVPLKEKPPEPPKPKVPPPPKLPPPPPPKDLPVPKIKIPDPPKMPEPPKPVEVKIAPAVPKPVAMPAPPKIQVAAAAPTVVNVRMPAVSASIKNNDTHPTAVSMGHPDSLVPAKTGPAVSAVNLNQGYANMPASNAGRGPVSPVSLGGNGQPTGSIGGKSPVAVAGIPHGVIGGDPNSRGGNANYRSGPTQVQMGQNQPPPVSTVAVTKTSTRTPPTVTYKPAPVYTEEARAQHIEGAVRVHIRVLANGTVQVIGVTSGLGHGLDQSALQVCQAMKFKPAVDSNGNPVDWDGNVTVSFQLA